MAARQGAKHVAITNAGTIPDRGLYGVFLADGSRDGARVGELDEEMVFEARAGETFLLGASTWRIEQITHDRVLVSPAPGEPGKMPFWKGEGPGRPDRAGTGHRQADAGAAAGASPADAVTRLTSDHGLNPLAAENLLQYLDDQQRATGVVPDDRTILIERSTDDVGDWRLSVLTPFGSRVHAPWAMAVTAQVRDERGLDVEVMWSDDGFVVRMPESDRPLDPALLVPGPRRRGAAGGAPAGLHGDVRGAVPRGRRPGAAPAQAPSRRSAPRCGSSASARPICWRWRRGSARSR